MSQGSVLGPGEDMEQETFLIHVEKFVRDIDAWMAVNKLKLNRDKTELVLSAHHRQAPHWSQLQYLMK